MVTQLDSRDGKTHKDPDRPSPSLVETDSAAKEGLQRATGTAQHPGNTPARATSAYDGNKKA